MLLGALLSVFKLLAVAIGAGAATVMIAQSLAASEDKVISKDEDRLLRVVALTARAGLLLLIIFQTCITALSLKTVLYAGEYVIALRSVDVLTWSLIAVLFVTVVFIDYHIITRRIGAALQIATWYSLVFVTAWPFTVPLQIDSFVFAYLFFAITSVFIIERSHLFTRNTQKT